MPGGFGSRGVEGKIAAIHYARTHHLPYFGLCYGLQLAVVEYARNVLKLKQAQTTEIDQTTPAPITAPTMAVAIMKPQPTSRAPFACLGWFSSILQV